MQDDQSRMYGIGVSAVRTKSMPLLLLLRCTSLFRRGRRKLFPRPTLLVVTVMMFFATATTRIRSVEGASDGCRMEIWVFDELDRCEGGQSGPNAKGFIYADGTCRTVEVTSGDISSDDYNLLPGAYSAVCTSDGSKIRFEESGCVDSQCTPLTSGGDVCQRDFSYEAALYSRLEPPEFKIQDPENASVQGFFSCTRLIGTDITVTFTVFGDCSTCTSGGSGTDDNTDDDGDDSVVETPIPVPTPKPSRRPEAAPAIPTRRPVTPDPTRRPVVATEDTVSPTPEPTKPPQTSRPTPEPTRKPTREPTKYPTKYPVTLDPTLAPITPGDPTSIPTISPMPSYIPSRIPTIFGTTVIPTVELQRIDIVNATMIIAEINELLSSDIAKDWMEQTSTHIEQTAKLSGYTIGRVMFVNDIKQELLDSDGDVVSYGTIKTAGSGSNSRDRDLNDQTATTTSDAWSGSIRIKFSISVSFPEQQLDEDGATSPGERVLKQAFDTEADRTQYLFLLVNTDRSTFRSARYMHIEREGSGGDKPPTASVSPVEEEPAPTATANGLLGIVIGATAGFVAVLIATALFIYTRMGRKDSSYSEKGSGFEEQSPSTMAGSSPNNLFFHNQNQRWTNEILVDPQLDDVSTLGGSILAGLHLAEGLGVEDEPTASVHVDYDFAKQQYRTTGMYEEERTMEGDIRSRSVSDKSHPTTSTNFTKLGMLGEGTSGGTVMMFADDMSFDRQYDAATLDDDDVNVSPIIGNNDSFNNDQFQASNNTRSNTNFGKGSSNQGFTSVRSHPNSSSMMVLGNQGPVQSSSCLTLPQLKPFEVRVPPGLLGMVLDTPGGIPVVRAIKSTSILQGRVAVGDQLLSVDNEDVTTMSVIKVSSLISTKSHLHRTLVFQRPPPPPQILRMLQATPEIMKDETTPTQHPLE